MNTALRHALLTGTVLLGLGCAQEVEDPGSSNAFPQPTYIQDEPADLKTRVHGFVWDPEAFFLSFVTCGGESCPLPPMLFDYSPLYLRSVVQQAPLLPLNPMSGQPLLPAPVVSDASGLWSMAVPWRDDGMFFPMTPGSGSLSTAPLFPLPPIPPATYLPTVTLRPVTTRSGTCTGIEAISASNNGILDAVVKNLSLTTGTPTTVADLLNPAKFLGVTVFWSFQPGFPYFRFPAQDIALEASSGQVIHVQWAPPGSLPPEAAPLQSPRGFFAPPGAPTSNFGIAVVLHRNGAATPPVVRYQVKDPKENAAQLRPYRYMPIDAPPIPGVITYAAPQLWYSTGPSTDPVSPTACVPAM
jgi:hypothetical protein